MKRARCSWGWRAGAPTRGGLIPFALALASWGCGSGDRLPRSGEPSYQRLSETGLYSDLAAGALAPGVRAFEPRYALWSDGADKARWIALPAGTTIDTTDMNRWVFPLGARLWKEFSLDGVRLETRLIERFGPGPTDYWMGAFVWEADGSDALLSEEGAENLLGTEHDAPARDRCTACHNGEPGRVLGFSALQLEGSELELNLGRLAAEGWLSASPPAGASLSIPGDAEAAAAFGYLHANCGSCHNPRGTAWPDTQMRLRLDVGADGVSTAAVFDSVVGQPLQYYRADDGSITQRVVAGQPESSGLVARMQVRGPMEQMPPLATERVDDAGVELVSRWIDSLPE